MTGGQKHIHDWVASAIHRGMIPCAVVIEIYTGEPMIDQRDGSLSDMRWRLYLKEMDAAGFYQETETIGPMDTRIVRDIIQIHGLEVDEEGIQKVAEACLELGI